MDSTIQSGSFRGVPFLAKSHSLDTGRRVVQHEYPFKEKPFIEDMGPKGRMFRLEFYVLGDDYMDQRDALLEALRAGGPGTLIHPWLKRQPIKVSVSQVRVNESVERQRIADFSVEFFEYGASQAPTQVIDTADAVREMSDALAASSAANFVDTYSVAGQPSWSIDGISDTMNTLAETLRAESASLIGLLSTPESLAQSMVDSAYSMTLSLSSSVSAFRRAAEIGLHIPPFPFTTSVRQQQARNQKALINLARQAAVAAAAGAAAEEQFVSRDDAYHVLVAASDAINAMQNDSNADGTPVSESVYFALSDLRSALSADLHERGLRLPQLRSFTPVVTLPALVLAHHLYGDADRDQEIIDRNSIQQPGFVVGGTTLEVLSE